MFSDNGKLYEKVFRTARDYHAALAQYCHALRAGRDIETPCQVLISKGVFYHLALSELSSVQNTPRLQERLAYLRRSQLALSRRYALLKQPRNDLRAQAR